MTINVTKCELMGKSIKFLEIFEDKYQNFAQKFIFSSLLIYTYAAKESTEDFNPQSVNRTRVTEILGVLRYNLMTSRVCVSVCLCVIKLIIGSHFYLLVPT